MEVPQACPWGSMWWLQVAFSLNAFVIGTFKLHRADRWVLGVFLHIWANDKETRQRVDLRRPLKKDVGVSGWLAGVIKLIRYRRKNGSPIDVQRPRDATRIGSKISKI
jgi:hypothetical protein